MLTSFVVFAVLIQNAIGAIKNLDTSKEVINGAILSAQVNDLISIKKKIMEIFFFSSSVHVQSPMLSKLVLNNQ